MFILTIPFEYKHRVKSVNVQHIGVVIYLSSLDITDIDPFIFIQGGSLSGR